MLIAASRAIYPPTPPPPPFSLQRAPSALRTCWAEGLVAMALWGSAALCLAKACNRTPFNRFVGLM